MAVLVAQSQFSIALSSLPCTPPTPPAFVGMQSAFQTQIGAEAASFHRRFRKSRGRLTNRAILYPIVEFDLKFLPVLVTAYSQTSTLRSR
jgi:hypothetical protein